MIGKQLDIGCCLIYHLAAIAFGSLINLTYDYSGVGFGASSLLTLSGIRVSAFH